MLTIQLHKTLYINSDSVNHMIVWFLEYNQHPTRQGNRENFSVKLSTN